MKTIKNIFGILLAMVVTTAIYSCEDEPEYTPAVPETGKINVYFAGSATSQTFEVEPGTTTFDVTLERQETTDAATVELMVVENQDNVFKCPTTVNFAAGQKSATITVDASAAEDGIYYDLTLRIVSNDLSNYTEGNRDKTFTFAIMKWEAHGTGYWVDNAVSTIFTAPSEILAVDVEIAKTSTSTRFRFASPYASVATDKGNVGGHPKFTWYKGYPYNDPADVVPGEYTFLIVCDQKGAATLSPVDMGLDWGYGMFSMGTILGNMSNDASKYSLGKYDAKAGVVTFPPSSLYVAMTDWGSTPITKPGYLYLSAEAFLEANKELDYDADFTWENVEDAKGTFISTAVDAKWIQTVEEATDATKIEDGLAATTKLYRFPSLYAAGKNIVFYHDTKENLISMPKGQDTGLKAVGNAPIWLDLKSATIDSKGVFTFSFTFYTVDEDEEKVSDLGTITETFKWGYTGVKYEDLKGTTLANYAGYWNAPILDFEAGTTDATYVYALPVEGSENKLAIKGLSIIDGYDDTVFAEYNPENGLLYLSPQWAADCSGYNMFMFLYDTETTLMVPEGYGINLVGGMTADGVFAFVNNPQNEIPVNSVFFGAHDNGQYAGYFTTFVPSPMEWTPVAGTRAIEAQGVKGNLSLLGSEISKKSDVKTFSSRHTATKWSAKKLIEGNNVIR